MENERKRDSISYEDFTEQRKKKNVLSICQKSSHI